MVSAPLRAAACLLVVAGVGCVGAQSLVSVESVKEARGKKEGRARVFSQPCAKHLAPVRATFHDLAFELRERNEDQGELIAAKKRGMNSSIVRGDEDIVAVWLTPAADGQKCRVEFYSPQGNDTDWEEPFFKLYKGVE